MKRKQIYIKIGICFILIFAIVAMLVNFFNNSKIVEISYAEARQMISSLEVTNVDLFKQNQIAKLYAENSDTVYQVKIPNIEAFCEYMENILEENNTKNGNNEGIVIDFNVEEEQSFFKTLGSLIVSLIPTILIIGYLIYSMKRMLKNSPMKIFGGNSEEIKPATIQNVTFKDVAGIDKELAEVEEVVYMLKNPEAYKRIGATIPRGVLLTGEPGTGKTLIAKAIANEAGVPFFNCAGSNFENTFVGVGASKVRELFDAARKNAPAIIFVDEIDAIGQSRYTSRSYSEQTLNQLLTEMDGFDEQTNIIVIAATNHPEVLDSAITRAGRFDRIIDIPLPDKKGRKEILEVHARNKKFENGKKEEILVELSKKTVGMSGADLENILNEAAIMAIKKRKIYISKEEIDEAFIKIILGISKEDKEVSEKEKVLVAVHEAGHTIASRITDPKQEILQVSIVARGNAGGYTLFADSENMLPNIQDLKNELIVSLGGRAAEEHWFKTISTGASADLIESTSIAHEMIYRYAMGTGIQMVRVYGHEEYNAKLEDKMFPEMENLIKESYETTLQIMKNHHALLEEIVNMLVAKSTLNSSELEELFSKHGV